jgi:hypothetical protein
MNAPFTALFPEMEMDIPMSLLVKGNASYQSDITCHNIRNAVAEENELYSELLV